MKSKTMILTSAAILSVLALSSCKGKGPEKNDSKTTEDTVFAVTTYKTKEGNLDDYLEFGGDVSSISEVSAMPDTSGKLSRLVVSVGDSVKKDQILCYVDASRPGMNYAASPVKAPISGTVTSFPYTVGATVTTGTAVAKIARTKELQIKVNIPERFISRIKERQTASVYFDAWPSDEFKARVFEISPVIDSNTRTMSAKLKIEPPSPKVKAGMYARVKLITESVNNAIIVPSNAIITRDGRNYLFIVTGSDGKNGKVSQVPVKLGITVDDKTEIQDGISAGDEIVIKGQALLNDGVKVTVVATTN